MKHTKMVRAVVYCCGIGFAKYIQDYGGFPIGKTVPLQLFTGVTGNVEVSNRTSSNDHDQIETLFFESNNTVLFECLCSCLGPEKGWCELEKADPVGPEQAMFRKYAASLLAECRITGRYDESSAEWRQGVYTFLTNSLTNLGRLWEMEDSALGSLSNVIGLSTANESRALLKTKRPFTREKLEALTDLLSAVLVYCHHDLDLVEYTKKKLLEAGFDPYTPVERKLPVEA